MRFIGRCALGVAAAYRLSSLTLNALEGISVAFAGDILRTCQPAHESRNAIPDAGAIMAEMEKANGEEQRRC